MATGALDANGIWIYGEDDSEPTFSGLLNKLGDSVSDKFTGGLPIASGGTGATTVAAAQTNLRVGLVPISPTSVEKSGVGSTATVNALGQLTFADCTSLSLNGVFSSAYKNYKLICKITAASANANVYLRYRETTSDTVGTSYNQAGIGYRLNGTSVGVGAVSFSAHIPTYVTTSGSIVGFIADIMSPQVSEYLILHVQAMGQDSTGSLQGVLSGFHSSTTQFTGISILPSTGAIGGSIQVFGYND